MSTVKWVAPESIVTHLTTELNSLANAAFNTLGSTAIDNETDLYRFMEIELHLASLTPTGSPYINIYLVKQIDGTNYEDSGITQQSPPIATFPLTTSTGAKHKIKSNIPIPPCVFKLQVESNAGPSLAGSGNTLKYRRYNTQVV